MPTSLLIGARFRRLQARNDAAWVTVCLLCCTLLTTAAQAGERVRVGVLKFGTVNWELDVIRAHRFAEREGIELEVLPLATKNATNVAIQGGAVDMIVSDWIWVSRQRAMGRTYTFAPYSMALGAIMTRPDAGVETLAGLKGKRLGVAGGPVDKSWLLLRAYARKTLGEDLATLVEPNFAAPPLLNQLALRGEVPAVLNYWHYAARLEAAGLRSLVKVTDVLSELGVATPIPLVGWVFDQEWADAHRDAVAGFFRASRAAKRMMLESDAEWDRLRPLMKVRDDAEFRALREAYRAGIPRRFGAPEVEAARRVFEILAREGGEALVGSSRILSPGTFWNVDEFGAWLP